MTSETPFTRGEALRLARQGSRNPDSVQPYPHEELEAARFGRGYAFTQVVPADWGDVPGYVLVTPEGVVAAGLIDGTWSLDGVIAEHLARHAHAHRVISDEQLGPSQRLALAAFASGADRIAVYPEVSTRDAATADHAEYVLLVIRRFARPGQDGRRVLAGNDQLLESPEPGRRYTHPCPLCARPSVHAERYPRSVCDHCFARTTDSAGRPVSGANVSLSGGMVAHYTDTPDGVREECVEVTRTGRCLIDGRPAHMQEARFGGIVVEAGE
ncbi:hypothetical protein AB0I28_37460 [Phytomonospora sp. NPDC050363]|uniref:hypothetical protein n=1 Tax=Phytomonospora sp. NPDC050363 TaxID=3155642 RepID=UPI0034020D6D